MAFRAVFRANIGAIFSHSSIAHLTLDVALAQLVGGRRGGAGGRDAQSGRDRSGGRPGRRGVQHGGGLKSFRTAFTFQL